MQLKPLYRVEFFYTDEWGVNIEGTDGTESQHFFFGEGRCSGMLTGRFRGANHPRRRTDHTYLPDFQGVILTDDGASVYLITRATDRRTPLGVARSSVRCGI